ncbi:hypothetical protein DFJ74DRAFT_701945 [Hyaloraphidium curvatum]|nr:hypothetical protein DFJ74DRAFT_701945 [Hyaloraphidium curvatum]
MAQQADKHALYAAAVQLPRAECRNLYNVAFRLGGRHARPPRTLREDFCGTAAISLEWCRLHVLNRAYGVELDGPTAAYARESLANAPEGSRATVVRGNALWSHSKLGIPKADVICALNYSACYLHERGKLLSYLRSSLASLEPRGALVLDLFGSRTWTPETRRRRHPGFDYIYEQGPLDPVTGVVPISLSFQFPDGSRLRRAFAYDFRCYSIPEVREAMLEAGFGRVAVYVGDTTRRNRRRSGSDDGSGPGSGEDKGSDEEDGEQELADYVEVTSGEQMAGMETWNAYVVGIKAGSDLDGEAEGTEEEDSQGEDDDSSEDKENGPPDHSDASDSST